MNIAVVGSFQPPKHKQDTVGVTFEHFSHACKAIGKTLAEGNHRLMIAHRYDAEGKPANSAEALALDGFRETNVDNIRCVIVPHHVGDPLLKAHTEAVEKSDAVILIGGKEGTYAAGLTALLRRKMMITIPAFGGSANDLCEIDEIDRMVIDRLRNLDTTNDSWINILTNTISSEINSYPRILIVHGRGDKGTELRETIIKEGEEGGSLQGIAKPLIMSLSGKGALSVPEVFESYASRVSAAIAIITADDVGGFARRDSRGNDDKDKNQQKLSLDEDLQLPATDLRLSPRARENVWVEVGWFWGRLGRQRVFLWNRDKVALPSDLQGAAWSKGELTNAWPAIQQFIVHLRKGDRSVPTDDN